MSGTITRTYTATARASGSQTNNAAVVRNSQTVDTDQVTVQVQDTCDKASVQESGNVVGFDCGDGWRRKEGTGTVSPANRTNCCVSSWLLPCLFVASYRQLLGSTHMEADWQCMCSPRIISINNRQPGTRKRKVTAVLETATLAAMMIRHGVIHCNCSSSRFGLVICRISLHGLGMHASAALVGMAVLDKPCYPRQPDPLIMFVLDIVQNCAHTLHYELNSMSLCAIVVAGANTLSCHHHQDC